MRFKTFYMLETPVAYDDETTKKIGTMDMKSNTIWGKMPPKKATPLYIKTWVSDAIDDNILSDEIVGTGVSRRVKFNDGKKTVFKYSNSRDPAEQTKIENEIYEKYGDEYSRFLPKIYASGDNWQVIEFINKMTPEAFKKITGLSILEWMEFYKKISLNRLKEYYNKNIVNTLDILLDSYSISEGLIEKLKSSNVLCDLLDMCIKTGIDYTDFHIDNFGLRDNKLVVLDYGWKD